MKGNSDGTPDFFVKAVLMSFCNSSKLIKTHQNDFDQFHRTFPNFFVINRDS
jgi:hypothetical protein